METNVEVLKLEEGLRNVVLAFPAPSHQNFKDGVLNPARAVVGSLTVAELVQKLSIADAESGFAQYRPKRRAITLVLASIFEPETFNWLVTAKEVDQLWPEWGLAHLHTAESLIDAGRHNDAIKHAIRAHQLLPLDDRVILSVFDNLIRWAQTHDRISTVEEILLGLTRRRPSISNFSLALSLGTSAGLNTFRRSAVDFFLSINTAEWANWELADDYLDLSAAGSVCSDIVRLQAKRFNAQQRADWDKTAVSFLEKAVASERETSSRSYAKIRLAESYAYLLKDTGGSLSDEEFSLISGKAIQAAVDATSSAAARTGGKGQGNIFQASRWLCQIYSTKLERALKSQADPAIVVGLVEEVRTYFAEWKSWAFDKKYREEVNRTQTRFIARHKLFDEFEHTEIGEIEGFKEACQKWRENKPNEAVKKLLAVRSKIRLSAEDAFAIFLLLESWHSQKNIKATLESQVTKTLDDARKLTMQILGSALDVGDLEFAQSLLEFLKRIETQGSVYVLDRECRLLEEQGADPRRIVETLLSAHSDPARRLTDPRLIWRLLRALKLSGSKLISPDKAWELIQPGPGDTHFVLRLLEFLEWELKIQAFDRFADDIVFAAWLGKKTEVRKFPSLAAQSPGGLGRRVPVRCLEKALTALGDCAWASSMLNSLPGSFFADIELLDDCATTIKRFSQDADAVAGVYISLADGICRALIDSFFEGGNFAELVRRLCEWVYTAVPARVQVICWTQILGSNRDYFEYRLSRTHRQRIEGLREKIQEKAERGTPADYIGLLNDFLYKARAGSPVDPVSPGADSTSQENKAIVDFCVNSTNEFRPDSPNSSYWQELQRLVLQLLAAHAAANDAVEAKLRLVSDLFARLIPPLEERIQPISVSNIHGYKNRIRSTRSEDVSRILADLDNELRNADRLLQYHRWPQRERVDFREIVESCVFRPPYVSCLRSRPNKSGITAIRPPSPVWTFVDRAQLTVVVEELAANAWKQVESLGSGKWLAIELIQDGTEMVMRIRENSGNIPSWVNRSASNGSSRGAVAGTSGLGRTICDRIVEMHNGTLSYSADPDRYDVLLIELRMPLGSVPPYNEEFAHVDENTSPGFDR